jgi:hypothetical protein
MRHMRYLHLCIGLLLSVTAADCRDSNKSTEPGVDEKQLAELRTATAPFQSIQAAKQAGYSTQITPCWAHHSAGAMGYHYGNTALFDANVELLHPETVIYEPETGGQMTLVGVEYIVPLAAWEAAHHNLSDSTDVPQLLGQRFTRHSTLPIFKLHIWLWQENPSGKFADWNPTVSCQHADSTEVF